MIIKRKIERKGKKMKRKSENTKNVEKEISEGK
jgi:hypothetical protein